MAETPENPNINTGGAAAVSGSGSIGNNNFIGRDQTNITVLPPAAQIDGKPSIPRPPADFVGREAELDALCQSVEKGAIITGLHGLGGIGKTALALKAAERLQPHYPDGGIYLDLHGPDSAPLTSEQAFEHFIRVFYPTTQLPDSLADLQVAFTQALSGKRLLLLLDNARDRAQVAPLLDALPPGCLALVTSRVHFYYPGMADQHLDVLPEDKAVELLLEIAPRIGEQAGGQTLAQALASVCGCLPLALRVVASQLHVQLNLSPQDVLDFMQDALTRLEMTTADASLELSYQMLPDPLRAPWRKLAVFAGDFEEQAAAWVWGLITEETTEEEDKRALRKAKQTLGELISYSLIEYKDGRYHLHDLARLFTAGKMSAEEDDNARLIHAQYYYQVLNACDYLYLQGNEKILAGLAWFDRERREITAGRDWTAGSLKEAADNTATGQANRLWLCCYYPDAGVYVLSLRLHPRERICWLEQALSAARRLNDRKAEELHLGNLGTAYKNLGEVQRAIGYYEQQLVIAREIGDQRGEGNALGSLGTAYKDLGEVQRAIGYYEQALVIDREIGDRHGEGIDLGNLGIAYKNLGEVQRAIAYYKQALVIDREIGDRRGEGADLGNLGLAYANLGEVQRAIGYYEQRLVIAREIGDRRGEGAVLGNLGIAYKNQGEVQRAIAYYEQSLVIKREIGDRRGEANTCWNLGLELEQQGDLAGAVALMQVLVDYLRGLSHPDAEKYGAQVEEIRARMAGDAPPSA